MSRQGIMLWNNEKLVKRFGTKFTMLDSHSCWLWQDHLDKDGYGQFWIPELSTFYRAHRVAWEMVNVRQVPDGMLVCHKCENRHCVNPDHLYLGTHTDNMRDKYKDGTLGYTAHPKFYEGEIFLIRKIGNMYKRKPSQAYIAKMFKTNQSVISRILSSETYPTKGGIYA